MTVLPGQITSADIASFIADQGFTTFASQDGKLPTQPDEVIVITQYGGGGFAMDGLVDQVNFQLRIRGPQNDPVRAEELAWDLDGMLVPPPLSPPLLPGMMGAQYVERVVRNSPPTFLLRDSARRTHFTCNYTFVVSRVATV